MKNNEEEVFGEFDWSHWYNHYPFHTLDVWKVSLKSINSFFIYFRIYILYLLYTYDFLKFCRTVKATLYVKNIYYLCNL